MRAHIRSGGHVRGHFRNGHWVSPTWRSDSEVSGGCGIDPRMSEESLSRVLLESHRSKLAFWTECFLDCRQRVFFYRSENGGCALFDAPGEPWAIHSCWAEYRENTLQLMARRISPLSFDGVRYTEPRVEIRHGRGDSLFLGGGFVEGTPAPYRPMPSARGSSSLELVSIRFVPDHRSDHFLTVVVPAYQRHLFTPYSLHVLEAEWVKQGGCWHALGLSTSPRTPLQANSPAIRLLSIARRCTYCGCPLPTGTAWGLDVAGEEECRDCGRWRGRLAPDEFRKAARRIARRR